MDAGGEKVQEQWQKAFKAKFLGVGVNNCSAVK